MAGCRSASSPARRRARSTVPGWPSTPAISRPPRKAWARCGTASMPTTSTAPTCCAWACRARAGCRRWRWAGPRSARRRVRCSTTRRWAACWASCSIPRGCRPAWTAARCRRSRSRRCPTAPAATSPSTSRTTASIRGTAASASRCRRRSRWTTCWPLRRYRSCSRRFRSRSTATTSGSATAPCGRCRRCRRRSTWARRACWRSARPRASARAGTTPCRPAATRRWRRWADRRSPASSWTGSTPTWNGCCISTACWRACRSWPATARAGARCR
ncbi:hypothetical protein D3C72_1458250 [compost metagenome]